MDVDCRDLAWYELLQKAPNTSERALANAPLSSVLDIAQKSGITNSVDLALIEAKWKRIQVQTSPTSEPAWKNFKKSFRRKTHKLFCFEQHCRFDEPLSVSVAVTESHPEF